MTDIRLQQLTRVLEMAQQPVHINETVPCLTRLWRCSQAQFIKIECSFGERHDERPGNLLFHEVLTFVAQSNAQGYIGEQYLGAALASARDVGGLQVDTGVSS